MKLFKVSRRKTVTGINLTALIDIMFMLVIFLSVTGTFREQNTARITLPESSNSEKSVSSSLTIGISASGEFLIDQEIYTREALRRILRSKIYPRTNTVLLNIDQSVRHKKVIALLDLLRESQYNKIAFGTLTLRQ